VGVALALLLLGGSLVLAGQALDPGGQQRPGAGSSTDPPPVPPAPALLPVEQALVAASSIDLEVALPDGLTPRRAHRLRVYVNDELVRERRLPDDPLARLADVPLEQGQNRVTAALAGPGGESLHSAALLLERDDEAPVIHISSPASRNVFTPEVTLRGRTEGGALLTLRNTTNEEEYELDVAEDGLFEVRLSLTVGENVLSLRSRDRAGNRGRATLRLMRVESGAAVSLEVRPAQLRLEDLPASISLYARVQGLRGEALHGVAVTFSLSVPGQQTLTYQATSQSGLAVWRDIRLPRDGAHEGHGLATVMVVLGEVQGEEVTLQDSAAIRFR